MPSHTTRESWLLDATGHLWSRFPQIPKAKIRIATGFPKGGGARGSNAIGQCWDKRASADGVHEIFVSPVLGDPVRILDVVMHEMIHAGVGLAAGYKKPFKRVAESVGLMGKMTATVASDGLRGHLAALVANTLGPYPHAVLDPTAGRAKQGTRLLKMSCPVCGYTVRVTRKWADYGLLQCVCEHTMELEV